MTRIRRMLVPTDFSATSNLALTYAMDLAHRFGASMHIVHVLDEARFAAAYPDGVFVEPPGFRQKIVAEAHERLNEAVVQCQLTGVACTTDVLTGRPSPTIVQEALDRGTDLIVMGTHGRSGVAHLFIGSVAERVVRTAPCPVLTVRDTARVVDSIIAESVRAELEGVKA